MNNSSLKVIIRSLFAYILLLLGFIFILLPCMILIKILPRKYAWRDRIIFRMLHVMYWIAIKATFVPVEIIGKENLLRNQRAIYIANHQSALDIPVVGYLACCNPQVWFALEYYVDKPIVGFFIRNIGVAIDRDDAFKAARSLVKALKILEDKPYSFVIFPEGGRFNDGTVHEFLQGYVVVAKRTGLPIIPIYMPNNGAIYPPGSLVVYDHPLKIVVGKPFRYTQEETEDQFAQRVFAWFQAQQQNV